ncbi:SR30, partial [Symbiodinium sp. KB8]
MSVKVYIGNLPGDVREAELEDMFYRYRPGRIDIKRPPRGPAFAFVEFRDIRDAEDAVYDRDGINFDGGRIRVELSRGGRDRFDRSGSASRGGFHGRPPSDTGIRISGLPDRTSWQDLKDFARTAGDVNFAKMIGPDVGLVDFHSKSDFEAALPRLDGAIFKNRFGDEAKIRADPEVPFAPQGDSGPRGRSGSPGRYGPPPTHGSGDA